MSRSAVSSMRRVENKVAIVTGAASGMGRAHSLLLAKEGARVVVTDVDANGGAETVREIERANGIAKFVQHDISEELAWKRVVDSAVKEFGGVDILVNNAGTYVYKPTAEISVQEWDRVQNVNVRGTFLGCREIIPVMRARGGGAIVNVSSTFGLVGRSGFAAYCASKGAVRLMTKALAAELVEFNIRVNSLHPGTVATEMTRPFLADAAGVESLLGSQPVRRVAEPTELANAMLFLVSIDSSYVTGAELVVDGGYVMV
jgi:cyclopentanol dehydrogenase